MTNITRAKTRSGPACVLAASLVAGLVVPLALPLTGCSVLDRDAPGSSYFMLAQPRQTAEKGEPLGSILVRRASVQRPFDARGFVYHLSNGQWRTDAYNGFLADPGDMITDAVARALEDCGRFSWIAPASSTVPTDLSAETVVESFYCDFTDPGAPVAVVRMRTYLLDRADSGVRMRLLLEGAGTAPIADNAPRSVADALGVAVSVALRGVVSQLPKDGAIVRPER